MPTSQLAGNRQHRARNPRDLTGKEYQRQQAELKAKRDAEASPVNLAAIRHDAFTKGHAQGYEAGFIAGWEALVAHLVEQGVIEPDDTPEGE